MMRLRAGVQLILFASVCCVLTFASSLFASTLAPKDQKDSKASVLAVADSKEACGVKDADNTSGDVEKKVEEILKLLVVLKNIEHRAIKQPKAEDLLNTQIRELAGEINPYAFVSLLIKKTEKDMAVYRAILPNCYYNSMNSASSDSAFQRAFADACSFVDEQYNQNTQAEEWGPLVELVLEENSFTAMKEKAGEFYQQYVIDAFNNKHKANEWVDVDFAVACYEKYMAEWIKYIKEAQAGAAKES